MKMKLSITRMKRNDEIWETIAVAPRHRYAIDTSRKLFHFLRQIKNKAGLGKVYKIKEIMSKQRFKYTNIYRYEHSKPIPQMNEVYEIYYRPVLGKKKCINCQHVRKSEHVYCVKRGIILKKNVYKCFEWLENTDIRLLRNGTTLYKRPRTKGDALSHRRLL